MTVSVFHRLAARANEVTLRMGVKRAGIAASIQARLQNRDYVHWQVMSAAPFVDEIGSVTANGGATHFIIEEAYKDLPEGIRFLLAASGVRYYVTQNMQNAASCITRGEEITTETVEKAALYLPARPEQGKPTAIVINANATKEDIHSAFTREVGRHIEYLTGFSSSNVFGRYFEAEQNNLLRALAPAEACAILSHNVLHKAVNGEARLDLVLPATAKLVAMSLSDADKVGIALKKSALLALTRSEDEPKPKG